MWRLPGVILMGPNERGSVVLKDIAIHDLPHGTGLGLGDVDADLEGVHFHNVGTAIEASKGARLRGRKLTHEVKR